MTVRATTSGTVFSPHDRHRGGGEAVSIGEALAQARRQAGLSVAQVSQKTRIQEAIIRDIERDDYSACGGDFYARGHVRAIARAVGADAEPLIQQYDAARSRAGRFDAPEEFAASDEFEPGGFAAPDYLGSGGSAALASLRPVARAADARGPVRLQLARQVRARYVLIWFTRLPPDPAGTYQEKVYHVRLR